jgi:hypothetical protein
MTTTITDTQISKLRAEAAQAGDRAQVAICDLALDGDDDARAECAEVISGGECGAPQAYGCDEDEDDPRTELAKLNALINKQQAAAAIPIVDLNKKKEEDS